MKKNKTLFKKALIIALTVPLVLALFILLGNSYVKSKGMAYIMTPADCPRSQVAIVPGAYVSPDGRLCDMLVDRVDTAVELYNSGKVGKLIMTGDHGRDNYDEVNNMRIYAEKKGVPTQDIFMDHAGFSTYDSMYRARDIFMVQSAVVVTQAFHLPRAVYTARELGIDAAGVNADKHIYAGAGYYEFREVAARMKAFLQVRVFHSEPRFLGESIPVSGDGRLTHDQ